MIKNLLNKFGYVQKDDYILKSESDEKLRGVREMYESQLDGLTDSWNELQSKNRVLEMKIISLRKDEEKAKQIFDFNVGDPTPVGEARKGYVAVVAGFHKDTLEPKLKQMIAVAHSLLDETSNDRDFDLILKGVVYSFRELMNWGEAMHNEQVANQLGDEEKPDEKTLTERIEELTKE